MKTVLVIFIYLLVFLFGSCLASFLNVLVYRIPKKLSFLSGRSFCPNCDHQLSGIDLIPIFSYLALGGRCRYCKTPISPHYALVEAAGGVGAIICWIAFFGSDGGSAILTGSNAGQGWLASNSLIFGDYSPALAAAVYFAALCVLLTISLIDAKTMEIPDGLNIALASLALLSILTGPDIALLSRAIGAVIISLPLLLICIVIPGAFGGGDIKLMAAAGLLLGWQSVILAFLIGLLIGGSYGIAALITHKKSFGEHFAFGPALCTGIALAMFCGGTILDWYTGFM
jgi:leader peptidase (prepilin peptidase)/N-methyltransferase